MTKNEVVEELKDLKEEFEGTCWKEYITALEKAIELLETNKHVDSEEYGKGFRDGYREGANDGIAMQR